MRSRAVIALSSMDVTAALSVLKAGDSLPYQQEPAFRGGVELIAADVQVVDRDGEPIVNLGAGDFDVSLDGRRRKVVAAEFVSYDAKHVGTALQRVEPALPSVDSAGAQNSERVFVLAIDCLTFDVGSSRGVVEAARKFVDGLQPTDAVGIFAFPPGPKLDPTTDRAAVRNALAQVVGQRDPPLIGGVRLGASEMVDYLVDPAARLSVNIRVCGGAMNSAGAITRPPDLNCVSTLQVNVQAQLAAYEGDLRTSFDMLGRLFDGLSPLPHRKIVVLVSAGMPVSDRPGGRPDVGTLPIQLGERAARSNTTLYTLFIDRSVLERYAAESRSPVGSMTARDMQVAMQWLDQFSGSAGGALMQDLIGSGTSSFQRVLRETSAYYALGIESAVSDRDGRPHEIKVKVSRRGATVRARKWLVIPRGITKTDMRSMRK